MFPATRGEVIEAPFRTFKGNGLGQNQQLLMIRGNSHG
jgi:hypothetical protein